ncbi:immunity 49 family protein [Gordonia sp. CPCC 206044]|uniref:immunity 49 family protein n=1 Tax=Gordonia sp. CPCC 206044 TaxID=3140793 RepID=UPI003AF409ED
MIHVSRHATGLAAAEIGELAAGGDSTVVSLYDLVTSSPGSVLSMVVAGADAAAGFHFGSDPTGANDGTRKAARRAAQLNLAVYQLSALTPGESFVIELDDGGLESHGIAPAPADVNIPTWLTTYWWARATRNQTALDTLRAVDVDTLTMGTRFDRAMLGLVEVLRARDRGDTTWAGQISETVQHVASPTISSREQAQLLQLDLFGVLASIGDQRTFTEQLEIALTSHRTYWGSTAERRRDPNGFISLPLFGLAAMAADEGMQIEVESDYLPRQLIAEPAWMFEISSQIM